MDRIKELIALGQSCWMDDLTRRMIRDGDLARRVAEEGLRGITSNPSIFEKAITEGSDYDADILRAAATGHTTDQIYEELVTTDIRDACDILRPLYEETNGADGFVSLEVSPYLAHDAQASIEEAHRLWDRVGRPNLLIKIPGTADCVPAVEQLLFEGINVNITLLFSIASYEAVANAYMTALERRAAAGKRVDDIVSVASFFLSRIDTLVDQLLRHRIVPGRQCTIEPDPGKLLGRTAIANAKLAYERFSQLLDSARWKALAIKGAKVQRMLWASTSAKDPAYPDLMYVEPLIGAETISTMPRKTIAAFRDHGKVERTIPDGVEAARGVMADIALLGIGFELVTAQLENEGIQKFIEPFDSLMRRIAAKQNASAAPDAHG
jgi:transaldolase